MITICPKCALTLDVTAGDLRLGQGYVRCGRCSSVFNALASLREEPGGDRGALEPPAAPEEIPDSALEFDPSRSDLSKLFVGPSGEIEQMGSGSFETIVLEGDDGEPPWTSGEPSADERMEEELRELVSRLDRDLIGLDPDPAPPPDRARPPDPARALKPATRPVASPAASAPAAGSVQRPGVAAPPIPGSRNAPPAAATSPSRPAPIPPPAAAPATAAGNAANASQSVKRSASAPSVIPTPPSPAAPARRSAGPQFADAGARRLPPGMPANASGPTQAAVRTPGAAPGPAVAPSAPTDPGKVLNRAPLARPQTTRPANVRAPLPVPRAASTAPANPGQPAASRSAPMPATPSAASAPISTSASVPASAPARTPAPTPTAAPAPAPASASASAPTFTPAPPPRASSADTAAPREPATVTSEEDVEPFEIAPAVAAAVAAAAAARRRSLAAPGNGPAAESTAPLPTSATTPSLAGTQALLPAPAVGGTETAAEEFLLNLELDPPIPPAPRAPAAAATAVSLALVLLLFAQVIHHYRGDLVAHGWFAGPLTQLYATLGTPITPDWDVDAYEIRQLGAAAPATPGGSLVIRASVKNGAPRTQPVPVIQLTLQDRYGNRLGSRALEPGEYLAAGSARTTLAPGERVDTEIAVADPGQSAVGFEIDTCLHRSNGTLRCAAGDHQSP